ncbi:MAG: DEAD/DEAH box helicase [Actinomycetota bacterium]
MDGRMDLEMLLRKASAELESEGLLELVGIPARHGRAVRPDPPLPAKLRQRLAALGIQTLWTHQAAALASARAGHHTAVSTGTASGKSLCFNLPVIERILTDPRTRALYLYPTKALAQDQLRAIRALAIPEASAATYDGDTPQDERPFVRRYARIVLSNPDMVHFGILPVHARWAELFANLAFVVVDEMHVLRGVFGSHVGCILRRLRRVASHYGSDPTFIFTSATIGNPADLAQRLVGVPVEEVADDGAPRGRRLVAFWNPPWVDEAKGVRGSTNWESARLLAALTGQGVRSIVFAKSRKGAELVAKHARGQVPREIAARIRPYRAGYLASDRREIERQLFSGELLGVAATTALELGIDVGGLDAVVMNGFPGTVAGFWQQAGRAGRKADESVAVLIGRDDPLDQYYVSHPAMLLGKPHEAALVDTTNPRILRPHLGAAAFELPLDAGAVDDTFGRGAASVAEEMVSVGELARRPARRSVPERLHWARRVPPGRDLDIRSLGGEAYSIVEAETGVLLGTVDAARAFHQVHPGAVYLHQGDNYEVVSLDLARRVVLVEPSEGTYYTQARERSDIRILGVTGTKPVGSVPFSIGLVEVTEQVVSFARRDIATGDLLELVDLELPEQVLETQAFWYTVPPMVVDQARIVPPELPGALHAAEHAAIGILPLFAMADRWDIGGLSTAWFPQTGLPTVFIYDGYPGGIGIAERGFARAREHLQATFEAVEACPCEGGCPSCVQSPKCGNGNEPLDKAAALRLMAAALGAGAGGDGEVRPETNGHSRLGPSTPMGMG